MFLVKDQRSFIEKGICFAGPRRLARISLVEIGVEEEISTQTEEKCKLSAKEGNQRHACKMVIIGLIKGSWKKLSLITEPIRMESGKVECPSFGKRHSF